MTSELQRVAVVASAQTELREAWRGAQHVDLIFSAVSDALRGSGLDITDVDTVIDSGSDVLDGRSISNCGFLGAMGAHFKEESRVEEDGLWALLYAINKISGGASKVALVIAYSKPSESDVTAYYSSIAEPFYQRPVGLDQYSAAGIMANQYLSLTGTSPDALVEVAAHDWAKAAENSSVETSDVPDRATIAASEMVAEPLRRWQMSRPLDGAVAVVVAAEPVARRVTSNSVWITGAGSAMDSQMLTQRAAGHLEACEAAAQAAYRRAGMTSPGRFGIAEVSARSAADELMILEALGLAERGKAVELYAGSALAVNPSGGALPADPIMATGLVRLHEASSQLSGLLHRGTNGATSAVVHGSGGIGMQNHCVVTLEV